MKNEVDFKELWGKQESNERPDTVQLLQKAAQIRKTFRLKLIVRTIGLIASIVIMLSAGLSINSRQLTTTIGLALMVTGVVAYLITTNHLLPMLFKSNISNSSQEYLNQLIRIQHKNEFMHKVMIDVYFCLLTIGLWLYILQGSKLLSTVNAVLLYLVPSVFLAITWMFAKRYELKKISGLTDTIKKLESVNGQLFDEDIQ